MRKATSSILIGLACTSILSLSAGVQSVKADGQEGIKQTQLLKQSELQDANYTNTEPWDIVILFQGNNLNNGFITNKTTQLTIKLDGPLFPGLTYVIRDSSGNKIFNFKTDLLDGETFDITTLQVGEIYRIESSENDWSYFTFRVVDGDKIEVPTINKVTSQDTSITGAGVAGATVNLTIAGDTYKGTVDASGNYKISLNKSYAENSAITVTQEKDGITSDSVTATVVAPEKLALPTLNPVTALDQTVTGTGVPGAIIHLTINGESHLGEVGEDGKFSILTNKAYPAGSAITIYQEKNGVTSDSVTATVVAPEQLDVPKLNVVSDKDTKVTGTAAAGATIHLSINGLNFHTVASATGEFSINIEKNYPANTPIEVYQELNGVKSETTEVYVQLTANFVINKIKSNAASITGTGHPNAQITVQIDDEDFTGTVDGSGNFTINLQGATFKVGTDVTLTSVSSEGTETKTVQIYPQDPVISVVYAEDRDIRGTTDPGATVIITVGQNNTKQQQIAMGTSDNRLIQT